MLYLLIMFAGVCGAFWLGAWRRWFHQDSTLPATWSLRQHDTNQNSSTSAQWFVAIIHLCICSV